MWLFSSFTNYYFFVTNTSVSLQKKKSTSENTGILKRQVASKHNISKKSKKPTKGEQFKLWTTKRKTFKVSQNTYNVIYYYIFYTVKEHILHMCLAHIYIYISLFRKIIATPTRKTEPRRYIICNSVQTSSL